jgi:hypothetical protein
MGGQRSRNSPALKIVGAEELQMPHLCANVDAWFETYEP